MSEIVRLTNVNKTYGKGTNSVHALKNVNISINEGEFVAIIGPSGSGKSTFLNICGGLDKPDSGEVVIGKEHLEELKGDKLTIFRRDNIGFVFQDYNLIPVFSVYENVVMPIQLGGKREDKAYVETVLDELGIKDVRDRIVTCLSGGQRQRVAIARAIVTDPAIILADEPTGNLDSKSTEDVIKMLKKAVSDFGRTVIMITHNERLLEYCDRVFEIKDGMLKEKTVL